MTRRYHCAVIAASCQKLRFFVVWFEQEELGKGEKQWVLAGDRLRERKSEKGGC